MRYLQNGLGVLAALVFIAASAAMNYVFMSSQGKTELESHIFGAVSVAADVLKAMLPFYIASAVANRKLIHAGLSSVMFALLLAFALFSALGFGAGNRGAVTGGREAVNARLTVLEAELVETDTRISKISDIQDIQIVEASLARLRQDARWTSSKECTDATAARSREYCADYFARKGELAAASAGKVLIERQGELRRQIARLKEAGAGQEADPQAKLLSVLIRKVIPDADASVMQVTLVVMLAVLVEFGAAFGLYLATGHGPKAPRPALKVPGPKAPAPAAPAGGRAGLVGRAAEAEIVEAESERQRGSRRVRQSAPRVELAAPAQRSDPRVAAPRQPERLEGPERFRLTDAEALLASEG